MYAALRGGPIPHFDLSFWAAEKLAHPIQGRARRGRRSITWRYLTPVD